MRDVRFVGLAGRQFNRISRGQLLRLGYDDRTIERSIAAGQLVTDQDGVYAVAPRLEHDELGKWMGATLTAPNSYLSHTSSAAARDFWSLSRPYETVTRPGNGGPVLHGGVRVHRSMTLLHDVEEFDGHPNYDRAADPVGPRSYRHQRSSSGTGREGGRQA